MHALKRWTLAFGTVFAGAAAADTTQPSAAPDAALVERGAYLAKVGDCAACHTAQGGAPFAGGVAIRSPFGVLYAPNITPDPAQGIGLWSDDDFYRAMHEGVGKKGDYLYPAFPYQWFTRVSRDDVLAIRAYLRTVPPSGEPSKPNTMVFPFSVRAGLGPWNALYFHPGEFRPDAGRSSEWNRGAYLVQGLGHCGDCHTPKGLAMQPLTSQFLSGGAIDNWYAPNITSDPKRGLGAWPEDALVAYLKTGVNPRKGVAVGPMSQVIHESLSQLTDQDLRAMAVFLKSTRPIESYRADRPTGETGPHPAGQTVYLEHCAFCHQQDGKGRPGAVPALDGNGLVQAKGPEDMIRVVLGGRLATGTYGPMPAVGQAMNDADIAAAIDYARTAWSNAAPVIRKTGLVGSIRADTVEGLAGPGRRQAGAEACRTPPDFPPVAPINDPDVDKTLVAMKPETMLETIPDLIARVRSDSPGLAQADIVNRLMLEYCRIQAKTPDFDKPGGRTLLDRFGQLVYGALVNKQGP